jgi:hypothetical protein
MEGTDTQREPGTPKQMAPSRARHRHNKHPPQDGTLHTMIRVLSGEEPDADTCELARSWVRTARAILDAGVNMSISGRPLHDLIA